MDERGAGIIELARDDYEGLSLHKAKCDRETLPAAEINGSTGSSSLIES